MKDKKLMGKKSRAAGQRFELKVREDLESKGWIVDKWSNNVELHKENSKEVSGIPNGTGFIYGRLVKAKAKWAGPGRPMMLGAGFPDFIVIIKPNIESSGHTNQHFYLGKEVKDYWGINDEDKIDMEDLSYVIGVESKMDGKLDKEEKEKAIWLLDNHIFSKILIVKKGTKRGKIIYNEFK